MSALEEQHERLKYLIRIRVFNKLLADPNTIQGLEPEPLPLRVETWLGGAGMMGRVMGNSSSKDTYYHKHCRKLRKIKYKKAKQEIR